MSRAMFMGTGWPWTRRLSQAHKQGALVCTALTPSAAPRERSVSTHLVGLNLGNQVSERREAAQPHNGFRLLHGQALDGGRGAGRQHDLVPSQEVLELRIVGGLPAKGGGPVGVLDSTVTTRAARR